MGSYNYLYPIFNPFFSFLTSAINQSINQTFRTHFAFFGSNSPIACLRTFSSALESFPRMQAILDVRSLGLMRGHTGDLNQVFEWPSGTPVWPLL